MSSQLADWTSAGLFTQDLHEVPGVEGWELERERALAERARSDRSAFAELYRNHVDAVFGFTYRMSGSSEIAEEATSATFERALRSIKTFEWRGCGVRPWLLRIASNEVCEVYRRTSRANGGRGQRALQAHALGADGGIEMDSDEAELVAMRAAMKHLPSRYQIALSLRYLGGMSAEDAATAMGCTKPVFAVTLHRALGALRKEIGGSTEGRGTR